MSEGEEVRGPVQFHRIPVGVGGSREAEEVPEKQRRLNSWGEFPRIRELQSVSEKVVVPEKPLNCWYPPQNTRTQYSRLRKRENTRRKKNLKNLFLNTLIELNCLYWKYSAMIKWHIGKLVHWILSRLSILRDLINWSQIEKHQALIISSVLVVIVVDSPCWTQVRRCPGCPWWWWGTPSAGRPSWSTDLPTLLSTRWDLQVHWPTVGPQLNWCGKL